MVRNLNNYKRKLRISISYTISSLFAPLYNDQPNISTLFKEAKSFKLPYKPHLPTGERIRVWGELRPLLMPPEGKKI